MAVLAALPSVRYNCLASFDRSGHDLLNDARLKDEETHRASNHYQSRGAVVAEWPSSSFLFLLSVV